MFSGFGEKGEPWGIWMVVGVSVWLIFLFLASVERPMPCFFSSRCILYIHTKRLRRLSLTNPPYDYTHRMPRIVNPGVMDYIIYS
ncbi:hypothetical protein BJX63DRAFT_165431 [Aspergillus granulosus]|uniref:Secreted protein n=1 Tax=Aspergillus granulosus TaxID=176169 RepID=A0ABR4HIU5_9EURO